MTTENKWLKQLPESSEANGIYWAYDTVSETMSVAAVEWCEETASYKIRTPYSEEVFHNFDKFFRFSYLLRIKYPDAKIFDWRTGFAFFDHTDGEPRLKTQTYPFFSGIYWACCMDTFETFVLDISAKNPTPFWAFVNDRGTFLPVDNHCFLHNHLWWEAIAPSPPVLSLSPDELREIEKERARREELHQTMLEQVRAERVNDVFRDECGENLKGILAELDVALGTT